MASIRRTSEAPHKPSGPSKEASIISTEKAISPSSALPKGPPLDNLAHWHLLLHLQSHLPAELTHQTLTYASPTQPLYRQIYVKNRDGLTKPLVVRQQSKIIVTAQLPKSLDVRVWPVALQICRVVNPEEEGDGKAYVGFKLGAKGGWRKDVWGKSVDFKKRDCVLVWVRRDDGEDVGRFLDGRRGGGEVAVGARVGKGMELGISCVRLGVMSAEDVFVVVIREDI